MPSVQCLRLHQPAMLIRRNFRLPICHEYGVFKVLNTTKQLHVLAALSSSSCNTPTKGSKEPDGKDVSSKGKQPSGIGAKPEVASPPGGSGFKRDLINFPRPVRLLDTPPVVFGFWPKSWFQFFYKKTGVTGGYMLLVGTLVYLFSKEWWVVNAEFYEIFFILFYAVLLHRYIPEIRDYLKQKRDEYDQMLDGQQEEEKESIRQIIKHGEHYLWQIEGSIAMLSEAKRENVYLQMEAVYRSYLKQTYEATKKILDYQVEISVIEQNVKRLNINNWVIHQVLQSLTPEVKKNTLKKSIEDLKTLAVRTP